MEGDADPGQLNPTPPTLDTGDDVSPESVNEDLEEPDKTVTDASTEASVGAAVRPGGSRLASRRWIVAACAVLLVAAAGIGTGGYLALRSHMTNEAASRAEDAALAAAKDCVTATQAPDATVMAESQRKIIECATGDFGAQATLYSGVLVEAYQAAKAKVEVTNLRAAVERHNPDGSMDILVAVRVKVSNTEVQQQEQGYRLRVRMAPDNGVYKIARLDQVSK